MIGKGGESVEQYPAVFVAADITPLREEHVFQAAYDLASGFRKYKVDRLRQTESRCQSLGVELMLRTALRRMGFQPGALRYTFIEGQGPALADYPGLRFSLCHTGDIALCAAAGFAIGVDAEKKAEAKLRVAQRFFCPGEAADVLRQPTPEAQAELFFRYWTLKESFQKIVGMGFRLPMKDFEITLDERITVRQSVNGREYRFREYDFLPDYACSVCVSEGEFPEAEMVDIRDCLF